MTISRDKLIKRPKMIEDFFEFFSVIDVHDHLRQGSLRMEEAWKTKNWVHRLFATLFGIILTDCYLAYNLYHTNSSSATRVSFAIFLGRLCKQMCDPDPQHLTRRSTYDDKCMDTPGICLNHTCAQLIKHPFYSDLCGTGQKPRVRCKMEGCGKKTGTYCVTCSQFNQKECAKIYEHVEFSAYAALALAGIATDSTSPPLKWNKPRRPIENYVF